MTGVDELKTKFTQENPMTPSDAETLSFHSTAKTVKEPPRPPRAEKPTVRPHRTPVALTMGLSSGTPTPIEITVLSAVIAFMAFMGALTIAPSRPLQAVFTILGLIATVGAVAAANRPVSGPVLHDMERRFDLTVLAVDGDKVDFAPAGDTGAEKVHTGRLVVFGRRATLFDADGRVMRV